MAVALKDEGLLSKQERIRPGRKAGANYAPGNPARMTSEPDYLVQNFCERVCQETIFEGHLGTRSSLNQGILEALS